MTSKQEIDRTPLSVEVRLGIFFLILFLVSILLSKKQIEPVITTIEEIELPKSSIEIVRGDTSKMQVIFTFDGGSRDVSGNKILDVLSKHGLKTTFFLTGDFVALNPDLVKRMHQLGHEIFNHTQNHHYLTSLSSGEIASELQNMDKALVGITNKSSKPYFRPPYGDRDQRVSETAFEAGYQSVMWTVDALDWQESWYNAAPDQPRPGVHHV